VRATVNGLAVILTVRFMLRVGFVGAIVLGSQALKRSQSLPLAGLGIYCAIMVAPTIWLVSGS
jgi:hypothetical protein